MEHRLQAGRAGGLTASQGAFTVMPWVAMNHAFGQRRFLLTVIDGVDVFVGSGIMGLTRVIGRGGKNEGPRTPTGPFTTPRAPLAPHVF